MRQKRFFVKLTLRDEVIEDRPEFAFFRPKEQIDFRWVLRVLEEARKKKYIQSVALVVKHVSIGWEQIEEIHAELDRLHQAGKDTIAYLEHADNKSYYLGCGAQKLYLPPSANLELVGLRAEILFFKNLLDYLGIQPELFNLGQYKSAAEIFTREEMSEASRRMTESILSDLQQRLKHRIATRRSVSLAQVQEWIDHAPYTARQALEKGFIDGVCYEDEIEETLRKSHPRIVELPASKIRAGEGFLKKLFTFRRPQIAYMVAEGIITTGESRRGRGKHPALGSESLISFLRDARQRKRVKAVVLRVNSPGGSALASDLIWREVKLTDKQKPVIVSFANLAASGGYYISTAGRRIVAMPGALTGSIGVISGKFNLQKLFSNIGITVDAVDKGKRAGYLSPSRAFSDEEAEIIQKQMREFYEELFLKKVSENRNKPLEHVRELAEGRVWTGGQALQHGLIDEIGGVNQAIEIARGEAGISKHRKIRVTRYLKRRTWRDFFSLPVLETFKGEHVLALMPEHWDIY